MEPNLSVCIFEPFRKRAKNLFPLKQGTSFPGGMNLLRDTTAMQERCTLPQHLAVIALMK